MRTLLILDERTSSARLPSQIATLTRGNRIIYLGDTGSSQYRTLPSTTIATKTLRWLDLFRNEDLNAVLIANTMMSRIAHRAIELGCARLGATVYYGPKLVSKDVLRKHQFGDIAIIGTTLLDEPTLTAEIDNESAKVNVVEVPIEATTPDLANEYFLRAKVEELRSRVGTYVIASSDFQWAELLISSVDPDAIVISAVSTLAINIACEFDSGAPHQDASSITHYVTEWSPYWQTRMALSAGIDEDLVLGRSSMLTGPTSGPFAMNIDEDGDPIE